MKEVYVFVFLVVILMTGLSALSKRPFFQPYFRGLNIHKSFRWLYVILSTLLVGSGSYQLYNDEEFPLYFFADLNGIYLLNIYAFLISTLFFYRREDAWMNVRVHLTSLFLSFLAFFSWLAFDSFVLGDWFEFDDDIDGFTIVLGANYCLLLLLIPRVFASPKSFENATKNAKQYLLLFSFVFFIVFEIASILHSMTNGTELNILRLSVDLSVIAICVLYINNYTSLIRTQNAKKQKAESVDLLIDSLRARARVLRATAYVSIGITFIVLSFAMYIFLNAELISAQAKTATSKAVAIEFTKSFNDVLDSIRNEQDERQIGRASCRERVYAPV